MAGGPAYGNRLGGYGAWELAFPTGEGDVGPCGFGVSNGPGGARR